MARGGHAAKISLKVVLKVWREHCRLLGPRGCAHSRIRMLGSASP